MTNPAMKLTAICPDCGADIRFKQAPHDGDMLSCHACDALLEVISLDPIMVDWAVDYDDDDVAEEVEDEENW